MQIVTTCPRHGRVPSATPVRSWARSHANGGLMMTVGRRHDQRDDSGQFPAAPGQRILLLNPPVYDTRFHWARWQQPTLLLRLATHYKRAGAEVRLVDALTRKPSERLRRERVGVIDLDGINVNKWRFGISRAALDNQLRELQRDGWQPDEVVVECFTTFWWGELQRRSPPRRTASRVRS